MTNEIGYKIKELRGKYKMSAKQLGVELGLSQQHISRFENGKASLSVDTLYKISKVFNVNVEYFF